MNVLIDSDVIMDVFLLRKPFHDAAGQVFALAEARRIRGFISAVTFSNIYFLSRKEAGDAKTRTNIRLLLHLFETVAVDEKMIRRALDSDIADFEDAIQFQCALRCRARYIITRNVRDFPAHGSCKATTPSKFLEIFERER